jgi:hypothetical protein
VAHQKKVIQRGESGNRRVPHRVSRCQPPQPGQTLFGVTRRSAA